MPPLEAEYAACPICPSKAATEAVLMTTPRSPSASGLFSHIEGSDQVHRDDPAERFQAARPVLAQHTFGGPDASAVDDDVQRAEAVDRCLHRRFNAGFIADVGRYKLRRAAQFVGQRPSRLVIEIGDDGFGTSLCQQANACRAQAGCAAGYENTFVCELHCHSFSSSLFCASNHV
jgi:hypothetical protein